MKKKVFVGLSGGVDSAVSAALLKRAGYDVTGVFIKVWSPDFLHCTWREDRREAMRVSAHLDIPFITLDLEKIYKKEVVDYMINEYKRGLTPNPDVMCNKEVKFGAFYKFAKKHGAHYVATGHYAQIIKEKGTFKLKESPDKSKDQSYFVWNIKKEQLPFIMFPIGGMQKSQVRKLADKFGLPNATKKDSQGLCFLGKVDIKNFLSRFIKSKPGKVLDENGKVIGVHDGAVYITIGQRHGFRVTNKRASTNRLYVISKNVAKNTITVSSKINEPSSIKEDVKKHCKITKTNWLELPKKSKTYQIRFRYHQNPMNGRVVREGKNWALDLTQPFDAVTPGQSAVIYDDTTLVGGGVIG